MRRFRRRRRGRRLNRRGFFTLALLFCLAAAGLIEWRIHSVFSDVTYQQVQRMITQAVEETVEEETYRFGNTVFSYNTNELRTASSKVLITSRQADILRLLALNVNQAVSRDRLLEAVWGAASYANSLALNVQITYLRKALKNDPSVRIESLMKKGYVLRG